MIACTVHDRCSSSDPACIHHSYTLVHRTGAGVLGLVGAPAALSVIAGLLLRAKASRRSTRAGDAALVVAVVSCVVAVVGLVVQGVVMLLPAAFTVGAVVVAPLPPDPDARPVEWRRPGGGSV